MTTVAQLIEYLQTLPPETTVEVAGAEECHYSAWTIREDLDIPVVYFGSNRSDYSNNAEFISGDEPCLFLGRT
jgi:hypothetical protein